MKLKVSSKSVIKSVAGSIAKALLESDTVELVAIGPSAIANTVKAIATARGYLAWEGRSDLVTIPHYVEVEALDGHRTGINFIVKEIKN